MNCTNINYTSIVAQYLVIVNYIKTIYIDFAMDEEYSLLIK